MDRKEANIYMKGIAIMAFGIIAAVYLMTIPANASQIANLGAYDGSVASDEYFTEDDAESRENGKIREDSGMPCENPEQMERWLETYEQKAEEEVQDNEDADCDEEVRTGISTEDPTEVETALEVGTEADSPVRPIYSVGGDQLSPELQALLYDALDRHGISYFFEIAVAQCYQESHFNVWAENPNGHDKGILQYRIGFWNWNRGDIFDPAVQFELYAEQMAARLNSGLSAEECISRHNTSDYVTTVNWEYVAQVKQHLSNIREVR